MAQQLGGFRVAILATDGFEQSELIEPKKALDAAGAITEVVSPKEDQIKGWQHDHWGDMVEVDVPLKEARAKDYDALVLPGGVMNPDKLRTSPEAVQFVRSFFVAQKPIAAICHGPWTLIDAGVVKGRTMTSWPSLKADLLNAGATWVDQEVVIDRGLISSRKPGDLPSFNREMISVFVASLNDQRPAPQRTANQTQPPLR